MIWLLWLGWIVFVYAANYMIGVLFGIRFGWLIMLAVTGWFPVWVNKRIEANRKEEESALREFHKQEEAQRNTEEAKKEEFEKLPAWKRVELMKQQEAEHKEQ